MFRDRQKELKELETKTKLDWLLNHIGLLTRFERRQVLRMCDDGRLDTYKAQRIEQIYVRVQK